MNFQFEINTQETVGAQLTKQATKRQARADVSLENEAPSTRQKLDSSASPSTCLSTIPRARNVGGRPRKASVQTFAHRKAPTKLRKDRPVIGRVHMDVWREILGYCSPEFLLKARTVSRTFKAALSDEKLWKEARLRCYGPEMPDLPPGLTETQFADLLTGNGCQARGCNSKARRTYWAVQRRWCTNCFYKKTSLLSDNCQPFGSRARFDLMSKCIPQAKFDSWNHYQWVGNYDDTPSWARSYQSPQKVRVENALWSKLQKEFLNFLKRCNESLPGPGTDKDDRNRRIEAWFETKRLENEAFVSTLQAIEAWQATSRLEKVEKNAESKKKREEYFLDQARLTGMDIDAVVECKSYKSAVRISNTFPTARSWKELLHKIEKELPAVEEEIREQERLRKLEDTRQKMRAEYHDNLLKRHGDSSPEQIFVLQLADKIINGLANAPNKTASSDLIHLVLRGVFKAYEKSSHKPQCEDGSDYRLIMDDARMVYRLRILPLLSSIRDASKAAKALIVKCPACGEVAPFGEHLFFDDILHHLIEVHPYVKAFDFFGIGDARYHDIDPWYYAEWPRNLPIMAPHQMPPQEYHHDDDSEYQCEDMTFISDRQDRGAFDFRGVSLAGSPENFAQSIAIAANKLRGCKINRKLIAQMVMQFARARYEFFIAQSGMSPAHGGQRNMQAMRQVLEQIGWEDLFDGFCCLRCRQRYQATVFRDHGHSFRELAAHYLVKHALPQDSQWTSDMFEFPSSRKLREILHKPENIDALNRFQELFPPLIGTGSDDVHNDAQTYGAVTRDVTSQADPFANLFSFCN